MTDTALSSATRLSHSWIWDHHRHFYNTQSINAWGNGHVPHYITNSPALAHAYGQMIFGYLRDCLREHYTRTTDQQAGLLNFDAPVYIMELGAGSGRFAYHFLRHFCADYAHGTINPLAFKYVITDFAQGNLDHCRNHPRFQPYIEEGLLDFARFDALQSNHLELQVSGVTLPDGEDGQLQNPLIFLANYFFDSLPCDIFCQEGNTLYEALPVIYAEDGSSLESPPPIDDINWLEQVLVDYQLEPLSEEQIQQYYENSIANQVLSSYQETLSNTLVTFPTKSIDCLQHLTTIASQTSGGRMLVVSGDKGYSHEASLNDRGQPRISPHGGGLSMMVNYHALGQYIQRRGGAAMSPGPQSTTLNINAFVLDTLNDDDTPADAPRINHIETQQAYHHWVRQYNPDDLYMIKKSMEAHYNDFPMRQLLSYLRLTHWDCNIFFRAFPAIMERLTEQMGSESRTELYVIEELYDAIHKVWENYYYIGEQRDMAFFLAMLLFTMEHYDEALQFLEQSILTHGEAPSTMYNIGMCHYYLDELDFAISYVDRALELDPTMESARTAKMQLRAEWLEMRQQERLKRL
ncbi:MAG: hypothetical protein AAF639_33985 [Chloroflexota bacterium]